MKTLCRLFWHLALVLGGVAILCGGPLGAGELAPGALSGGAGDGSPGLTIHHSQLPLFGFAHGPAGSQRELWPGPALFDVAAIWELSGTCFFERTGTHFHGQIRTASPQYELSEGEPVSPLPPETRSETHSAVGYQAGLDQFLWKDRLYLGMTWFRIDVDNLIIYDMMADPQSGLSGEVSTQGMEGYLYLKPVEQIKLGLSYSHTAAPEFDEKTIRSQSELEDLPRSQFSLTASFEPSRNFSALCRVNWQEDEDDPALKGLSANPIDWEATRTTVDLAVSYGLGEHVRLWMGAKNVSDRQYPEGGVPLPGRLVYGGLHLSY